jgi:CBS-domain-containing membrane protein
MIDLDRYPHALDTQTLWDAVELLQKAQIDFGGHVSMPRVVLVFDAENHFLGMARRRDILRGLEPEFHQDFVELHPEAHFSAEIDPNLSDLIGEADSERLRARLDKPLRDVVREMPANVAVDDSLMKVVRELVGKDTHIAAVLDDSQVVGVVRSLDVLRAVTKGLD